jgi:hypothetical protein
VEKEVEVPIDPKYLAKYKNNVKRSLLDSKKDNLIPHIAYKRISKEIYDSLGTLYQSVNVSNKMLPRNKITMPCMCKIDTIINYLMKLEKMRDRVGVVGDEVKYDEIASIALNVFSSSWHNLVQVIYGWEKIPYFE